MEAAADRADERPSSRGGEMLFSTVHATQAEEILMNYFLHLKDHRLVLMCSKVCKFWRTVSTNNQIWSDLCGMMWSDKVYVPERFTALRNSGKSKEAFIGALEDSKRSAITKEELSTLRFFFRFKEVAGAYWTDQDPFWKNMDPLQIRFTPEGQVVGFPWDVLEVKWRFVDQNGKVCKKSGSFVRVSINDRGVPTYLVTRHTNWGFIMQNCWVLYFSFPIPPRGTDESLEDKVLDDLMNDEQWSEALTYNSGNLLPVEGDDED